MSKIHEQIVDMVILQWSREGRGRLFKNHNGTAYRGKKISDHFKNNERIMSLSFATIIKYGLGNGTSDLIGWEYVDGSPIFCCVEVKTKAYPTISKDQKYWLNNILAIGGMPYIAKENNNGYNLNKWIK